MLSIVVFRNQGRIFNVGSDKDVSIFTFSPSLVYTDMTKDMPLFKTFPDSA